MRDRASPASVEPEPSGAPSRWAITPARLGSIALAGLGFLVLGYLPLAGGDGLWGHAAWGRWILEHRALPVADPFLPLAEGMPVVDAEWLSQVVVAAAVGAGGERALAALFAAVGLASALLLAGALHHRTGSRVWALTGLLAAVSLSWGAWAAPGPRSFGFLCFALLLWLVARGAFGEEPAGGAGRSLWLAVPLFALWANLHPSFALGLSVLAAAALGRLGEVAWRTRSARAALTDRPLQSWVYLGEVAVLATLLNPYGIGLVPYLVRIQSAPTLRSLPEWRPPALVGGGGLLLALSLVLLMVALRFGRRRLPAAWVLLLALLGWGAVAQTRMLVWYGPVFALVATPLLADAASRLRRPRPAGGRSRFARLAAGLQRFTAASWHYSLLALVVVWGAFAFSPLGGAVLGREPQPAAQALEPATPLALTGYLRAEPPAGQIFNPLGWGDWLTWAGPPGIQPFVASRVEGLPLQVWQDYLRVAGGGADWQRVLDRYRVDTVVLDRESHRGQVQSLRYDGGWRLSFEGQRAAVFRRLLPTSEPSVAGDATPEAPLGEVSTTPQGDAP